MMSSEHCSFRVEDGVSRCRDGSVKPASDLEELSAYGMSIRECECDGLPLPGGSCLPKCPWSAGGITGTGAQLA